MSKPRRPSKDELADALRYQSEERFRLLVESVKDYAIFMLDPEGYIVSWNVGAEHITGYHASEIIGEHVSCFYSPEAREAGLPQQELERAAGEGRFEVEDWRYGKGTERFWASAVITVLRDTEGMLRGFANIVRDLSERRRSQELLAQNDERLRALIGGVRDYAIFMLDPDGVVISWNEGAERIKGYRAEEIIGAHFSRFYPPEAIERGWPQHELRMASIEGKFEDEGWRIRKDGSRFWANVVITALRDRQSKLIGFSKITRDLTERRRHTEELRQSEERFRLLIESVQDYAICMLDPDGGIQSWNVGAQRIVGYVSSEVIGHHFSRLYTAEDIRGGTPWRDLETAREQGRFESDGVRARKDGSVFSARVILVPMRDAEGRLRGYSHITHDLTQLRQMQSLEESSRHMNEFLALLSHELRNPLAPIRHAVTLMQGQSLPNHTLETVCDVLDHQVSHMTRVVDDLLDVSRVVHGTLVIAREPTEISAVVARSVEMVQPSVQGREQTLHVAPFDAALSVQGDLVRLTQALGNLLNNASKYTQPRGQIWLAVRRHGDRIELSVRDNGEGIAADQMPRIFDFFTQASPSTTLQGGGLGVGLALVRRLAELHGGGVEARSDGLGRGAEFVLWLPALPVGVRLSMPVAAAKPMPEGQALSIKRVLVVDDNADAAISLAMLLETMGYQVASACDGAQALKLAGEFRPDAALLDIGLPDIDGYELARQLRAQSARPPVLIALTGWGQEQDRERARLAGFDHHLVKPVDLDRLTRLLAAGAGAPGSL